MLRRIRKLGQSGIYHVMVRGVNQQDIFFEDEDRKIFLDRLRRYKEECGFKIYAYCLMNNHVHLIIHVGEVKWA